MLLLVNTQFARYLKIVWANHPRVIRLAHLSPLATNYGWTLDALTFATEVSTERLTKAIDLLLRGKCPRGY